MDACFNAFDKDGDGLLSISEFDLICRALFRNDRGKIYGLEEEQLREVYSIFDFKDDGMIDKEEFEVRKGCNEIDRSYHVRYYLKNDRSEQHTTELQSHHAIVCRPLLA